MIKWKKTTYPSTFIKLSDELAKVRSMLSADVYNKNTEKYRGKQEHSISQVRNICRTYCKTSDGEQQWY